MGAAELDFKEANWMFREWVQTCVPEAEQQNAIDNYVTALDAFARELIWKQEALLNEAMNPEKDEEENEKNTILATDTIVL